MRIQQLFETKDPFTADPAHGHPDRYSRALETMYIKGGRYLTDLMNDGKLVPAKRIKSDFTYASRIWSGYYIEDTPENKKIIANVKRWEDLMERISHLMLDSPTPSGLDAIESQISFIQHLENVIREDAQQLMDEYDISGDFADEDQAHNLFVRGADYNNYHPSVQDDLFLVYKDQDIRRYARKVDASDDTVKKMQRLGEQLNKLAPRYLELWDLKKKLTGDK